MQLVFHTGAHFTQEDRVMKCLLRNKDSLVPNGTAVPGPGRYRKLMRGMLSAMETAPAAPDARELLLDAILEGETADRVLLSHPHIFGVPRAALRKGVLYPKAPARMAGLAEVFAQDDLEFFMALRNPATFLPAAFRESPREEMADFTDGFDPRVIRWSDTLLRMREAAPDVALTVWCNEDAPIVWSQVIREIAGLDHGVSVTGAYDLLEDIMEPDGQVQFREYVRTRPGLTEIQLRRVMVVFLDKFARDDAIEEVIDMPGWNAELIADMTAAYEEDVFEIGRIPGVTLIAP
ncbi:hypothetical protein [uncultured Roseobacter sp.]|uniref:hypothetical protein n=1 Tax=uncultured Roseobacter sp. TaxID=114847 RepID=UPI002631644B|nr:hypothetical protein [uncultured Roseobacter sp.]